MMTNRIVTIAAFCVYLIFMLCIGMYFVGKNKTTTEYLYEKNGSVRPMTGSRPTFMKMFMNVWNRNWRI